VGRLQTNATVTLDADAQAGATAVTLVNSTNSSVANASNVWYAPAPHAADATAGQSNDMQQTHASQAYLANWQSQGGNSLVRKTETRDSQITGGITAEVVTVGSSGNETVKLGMGGAMAGEGHAEFGTFGLTFSDEFTSSLTTTTTTTTTVTFSLKFFKWKLSKTYTQTHSSSATTSISESDTENKTWGPFSASFKGVDCLVLLGSCVAKGHDNASSHVEEKSFSSARIEKVSAGRIVLSDGALFDESSSSVHLQDHAQRAISAVHAVNAAGSLVANGLNLGSHRSSTSMFSMQLQQSNLIAQRP
jgi:hypothetical protein